MFTPDRDRIGQAITRRVGVDVARLPVDEATKRLDELAAHEYAAAAAHRAAERQDEGRATALAAAGLIEDADRARDTAREEAGEAAAAERRGEASGAAGRDEQWRERLALRVERSGLTRDEAAGVARAARGNQQSVTAAIKSPARGRARTGAQAPRRRDRGLQR